MPSPLIRRADQATLAALTLVALFGAASWWVRAGGHAGGLVEIDNAPPVDYRFLVDINRAEWPELAQLPGIGPELARRIVAHRQEHGGFRSPDDLDRVEGIGPRRLEAIRRYVAPMADDTQVAGESEGKADADQRG